MVRTYLGIGDFDAGADFISETFSWMGDFYASMDLGTYSWMGDFCAGADFISGSYSWMGDFYASRLNFRIVRMTGRLLRKYRLLSGTYSWMGDFIRKNRLHCRNVFMNGRLLCKYRLHFRNVFMNGRHLRAWILPFTTASKNGRFWRTNGTLKYVLGWGDFDESPALQRKKMNMETLRRLVDNEHTFIRIDFNI